MKIAQAVAAILVAATLMQAATATQGQDPLKLAVSPDVVLAGDYVKVAIHEAYTSGEARPGNAEGTRVYVIGPGNESIVAGENPVELGYGAYSFRLNITASHPRGPYQVIVNTTDEITGAINSATSAFTVGGDYGESQFLEEIAAVNASLQALASAMNESLLQQWQSFWSSYNATEAANMASVLVRFGYLDSTLSSFWADYNATEAADLVTVLARFTNIDSQLVAFWSNHNTTAANNLASILSQLAVNDGRDANRTAAFNAAVNASRVVATGSERLAPGGIESSGSGWTDIGNVLALDGAVASQTNNGRPVRVNLTDPTSSYASISDVTMRLRQSITGFMDDRFTLRAYIGASGTPFATTTITGSASLTDLTWNLTSTRSWTTQDLIDLQIQAVTSVVSTNDGVWNIDYMDVAVSGGRVVNTTAEVTAALNVSDATQAERIVGFWADYNATEAADFATKLLRFTRLDTNVAAFWADYNSTEAASLLAVLDAIEDMEQAQQSRLENYTELVEEKFAAAGQNLSRIEQRITDFETRLNVTLATMYAALLAFQDNFNVTLAAHRSLVLDFWADMNVTLDDASADRQAKFDATMANIDAEAASLQENMTMQHDSILASLDDAGNASQAAFAEHENATMAAFDESTRKLGENFTAMHNFVEGENNETQALLQAFSDGLNETWVGWYEYYNLTFANDASNNITNFTRQVIREAYAPIEENNTFQHEFYHRKYAGRVAHWANAVIGGLGEEILTNRDLVKAGNDAKVGRLFWSNLAIDVAKGLLYGFIAVGMVGLSANQRLRQAVRTFTPIGTYLAAREARRTSADVGNERKPKHERGAQPARFGRRKGKGF